MSTDPTQVLETAAATEAALDIESIKEIMDAFDPAALLPELGDIFSVVTTVCQIAVMVAPILLLALGLGYLFFSPKEANYYFGYRCYFGMGSVEAWQFTQRLAGITLGALGLILSGVMLFITMGFPGMDTMEMVWRAFWCLIWQAVLALIANGAIWAVTAIRFDAKGNLRTHSRK
ncbi:MAG: SdpI family protein [Oscillospiraceae bacterium]|nr:SdpI family protein [Oscillospiraceae bacterium]